MKSENPHSAVWCPGHSSFQVPSVMQWTSVLLAGSPGGTHATLVCFFLVFFCLFVFIFRGFKTSPLPPTLSHASVLLVPMALGIPVECREHDGEDSGSIITDEAHDVLIVPVIEGTLCHLVGRSGTQVWLLWAVPCHVLGSSAWARMGWEGLPGSGG